MTQRKEPGVNAMRIRATTPLLAAAAAALHVPAAAQKDEAHRPAILSSVNDTPRCTRSGRIPESGRDSRASAEDAAEPDRLFDSGPNPRGAAGGAEPDRELRRGRQCQWCPATRHERRHRPEPLRPDSESRVRHLQPTGGEAVRPGKSDTLWSGFGGPCQTTNNGGPILLYDHLADRWLISRFALPNYPFGPFCQCIAISQIPDPAGAWRRYGFTISNSKMNDYPKFSLWPDL